MESELNFVTKLTSALINPIRHGRGGGGGLRGSDDQIQSCHAETSYPTTPKLCDFQFLSLRHALTKFKQNWSIREVAAALFSSRHPKNIENEKIFLCLKIAEIDMGGGGQFWVEENEFGHKNSFFFKVKFIFRGKYPNYMTCSPLQREFCDVISPKLGKLLDSNFASGILSWL